MSGSLTQLCVCRDRYNVDVRAVNMASLTFKEQLIVIRSTNILIGMHGAGLSHIMFLPEEAGAFPLRFQNWLCTPELQWQSRSECLTYWKTPAAVVLEMFPEHVHSKKHFRNLARWRGHSYLAWKNRAKSLEVGYFKLAAGKYGGAVLTVGWLIAGGRLHDTCQHRQLQTGTLSHIH